MSWALDKIVKRLRKELEIEIPDDYFIERTRAGHNQKSAGAWTAVIRSREKVPLLEIGFYQSIVNLLKCPKLEIGDSYGMYVDCGCAGGCKGGQTREKTSKQEKRQAKC